MSEYTREMIGNCRRWIKDLTDDSVNETLCADEFAGLLDDALDEIERQQARIAELEAENAGLKERVAMLDVTAVYKSLGEMGYIEQVDKLNARIAELEAERRWRVVADGEFPELGEEVIFYDSKMERRLKGCLRKNGGAEWLSDEGYTFSSRDGRYSRITHWMPLPKLPEVK